MTRRSEENADGDGPPPMPTWVKLAGILVALLVVTAVIVHLAGGGMGRHGR
jgi:hypothetical protein